MFGLEPMFHLPEQSQRVSAALVRPVVATQQEREERCS